MQYYTANAIFIGQTEPRSIFPKPPSPSDRLLISGKISFSNPCKYMPMAMRAKDLTTSYLAIRKIIINVQRMVVHTFPAHFGIGELHNTAILTTLQQFSQNFTIDAAPVVQLIVVVVCYDLYGCETILTSHPGYRSVGFIS